MNHEYGLSPDVGLTSDGGLEPLFPQLDHCDKFALLSTPSPTCQLVGKMGLVSLTPWPVGCCHSHAGWGGCVQLIYSGFMGFLKNEMDNISYHIFVFDNKGV